MALSGGDPSKVTGTANGTKTARQTFAEGVANSVNQQVESIQNNVNAGSVTLKPETPTSQDISAQAAQQSKEDNPVGYYAANAATWGSFLTKALYGNPLEEMQPTTTFAGPVGSAAQTSESAAGNVAAHRRSDGDVMASSAQALFAKAATARAQKCFAFAGRTVNGPSDQHFHIYCCLLPAELNRLKAAAFSRGLRPQ